MSYNREFTIFIEDFLVKFIQLFLGGNDSVNYNLSPSEVQNILMRNPESLDDIDTALEYLIKYNGTSSNDSLAILPNSISFNNLQEKLLKYQYLGENRIKSILNQAIRCESSFIVKPIESISDNYNSETLTLTYTILMAIIRSNLHLKNSTYTNTCENFNQLIDICKSYSLRSNFSPFNINLLHQIDDNNEEFGIFKGIAPGSSQIFQRSIVSNGHFIFILHSDFYLSIFPICIENGGLLSPLICKLKIDSEFNNGSLSFKSNKLVITSSSNQYEFDIDFLINFSSLSIEDQSTEIEPEVKVPVKKQTYFVTDGVVNVSVKEIKNQMIAAVIKISNEKVVSTVCLHKKDDDESLYEAYPFESIDDLFSWPAETNGLVLSFYIRTSPNEILVRQFSLIDGSHLNDETIETNISLSSISYDSINQIHHLAISDNYQLIVYSLSGRFDCSINPFVFGFVIPNLEPKRRFFFQAKDNFMNDERELIHLMSSILLSSIFFKIDIQTFLINERENIFVFPLFIVEIIESMSSSSKSADKEIVMNNIRLATIQILSMMLIINIRHQIYLIKDEKRNDQEYNEKFQSTFINLFSKLIEIKEEYSTSIIYFIFLNLFDLIDLNDDYLAILEGLLISSSSVQAKYIIHVLFENPEKVSLLSITSSNNVFNKYIINNNPLSNTHLNIISFLLCYQRCVINQLNISMKKEHFSTASLITDIKYNDCKTDNESLNNFAEYANFLVNQFSSSISLSSSFEEFQESVIFCLFDNFLSLTCGLYKYHEVAQIIAPLFFVLQNAIKIFFEKKNVFISDNQNAQDILIKMILSFGALTGTLIKGGNFSLFDEKYKWIIRPNMNLITQPDLLNDLDNPFLSLETLSDLNVQQFLSPKSDKSVNGRDILNDIYKKWNFNMNKNLNQSLRDLDQLFFAAELHHLNLFEDAKNRNINKLRPALQQMMRVRNSARAILRSDNPKINVPILNDTDFPNEEKRKKSEMESLYSPFDLIVIKCKMLLKLISKFDSDNISNAPKLLADFVLSNDQPSTLINYIFNQRNRLRLTNIGFSLIEASYSLKIDDLFINAIDTSLSISVDNFDGLSAIIRYDNEHKSEQFLFNFLSRALGNLEYPYLVQITGKLLKSEVLSDEMVEKLIEPYIDNITMNYKLFSLFYYKLHSLSDFLNSKFLFLDSKTGEKVPFNSLSLDDYDKITSNVWYLISKVPNKSPKIQSNILDFYLKSNFSVELNNLDALFYLSKCIESFYDTKDESFPLENVKKDFILLFNSLTKSLKMNDNYERANEIVAFFRRILSYNNEYSKILIEIFHSNKDEESMCSIFAILGGFIDILQLYSHVTFRIDREVIKHGVLLGKNKVVELPIKEESVPIQTSCIYPESQFPFKYSLFPDFKFVSSFFDSAMKNLTSPFTVLYLKSLTYYIREDNDFLNYLSKENLELLIQKLSPLMNPFDAIKDTERIISVLLSKKKTETFKDTLFSVMSSDDLNRTTYLSPVITKLSKYTVVVETTEQFKGYFGFISEGPLQNNFRYTFIDTRLNEVIPNYLNKTKGRMVYLPNNTIRFTIDFYNSLIEVQGKSETSSFPIVATTNNFHMLRIFISVINPCKVNSIKVTNNNAIVANSPGLYSKDYNPSFELFHQRGKLKQLIDFRRSVSSCPDYKVFLASNYQVPYDCYLTFNNLHYPPIYETINSQNILYNFKQADTISVDLINSIFMHVKMHLITQISTLIMMKLVNLGFGQMLYRFDSSLLIRLFSYLQIPLEPFDNEKLIQKEFPFNFDKSILNDDGLNLPIQQFDNLENEMKKCLQKIPNINSDIKNAMKDYIDDLRNDTCLQTLRNPNLNIEYYHLDGSMFTHYFTNLSNIQSMIISAPFLYQFNAVNLLQVDDSFPAVINLESAVNGEYQATLNVYDLNKYKLSASFLKINKESNHWVFGTSFEILLMLKEYFLLYKDILFVRHILLDLIIANSPFILAYVQKILLDFSRKNLLVKSQYTKDYLNQLFNIIILISKHDSEKYQRSLLYSFIGNERLILFTPWLSSVIPFFPEYFGNVNIKKGDPDSLVQIKVRSLDFPHDLNEIEIYTQCTNISSNSFITNLNMWIAASILYERLQNNERNTNNGIIFISDNSRGIECKFNPLKIHDDFINEMKMVDTLLQSDNISNIIEELFSDVQIRDIKNSSFMPIVNKIWGRDSPMPTIPPRVLLLLICIVHRINYLYNNRLQRISRDLWYQVEHLIVSLELASIESIAISESNTTFFTLHRFEAHRIAFEGYGKQSMSMIAQVSKEFSRNPAKFRNKTSSPWHIRFTNEEAADVGGPSRELYAEISMSIIEPTSGLFIISPNGRNKVGLANREVYIPFHAKPSDDKLIELTKQERIDCYKAIGVFIGIVIRKGYYQDLPFAPFVWNGIAGTKISKEDVFAVDEEFKEFIMKLQDASNDVALFEQLPQPILWKCADWDGSMINISNPMKSQAVSFDQINTFISNCINARIESLTENINHIKDGFYENVGFAKKPTEKGSLYSRLAQGPLEITVDQIKSITDITLSLRDNFWMAVERMNNRQRSLLIKFITGLPKIPNDKNFRISIQIGIDPRKLPEAATCFKTMTLPLYPDAETTYNKLIYAIENGQTMENV
ncbi:hypothetical protein M9Y10_021359 [Tritrichomonas musculus]|uniref:HECT domain-containing protein n=1 Tax=Tritrichomonas musculus TaxID=1915356 RepID=A0ABR2HFQ0_9EUKA